MTRLVLLAVAVALAGCAVSPGGPTCELTEVFENRCETEPVAPWCLDCNPCTRDFSCADYPDDPACCWRAGCVSVPYREGEGCSVTFGGVGVCIAGECVEEGGAS